MLIAYQGKGKGNQFLSDLCTADALVHVVDAAGLTDRGGNLTDLAFDDGGNQDEALNEVPTTTPTPVEAAAAAAVGAVVGTPAAEEDGAEIVDEMRWVPREIHLWVMTNLKAKMATWRKRPQVIASDDY